MSSIIVDCIASSPKYSPTRSQPSISASPSRPSSTQRQQQQRQRQQPFTMSTSQPRASSQSDRLPSYNQATQGQKPVVIAEKEAALDQMAGQKQSGSKRAALMSILSGDVQKHNPRYVLEEAVTGRPSYARQSARDNSMRDSPYARQSFAAPSPRFT